MRTTRIDQRHAPVYVTCAVVCKNELRVSWHRMHRTVSKYDVFVTNLSVLVGTHFHVGRTSYLILVPVVYEIVGDLDGRLGFGSDLPLLVFPSSPIQKRSRSPSGGRVNFHHSTNRTSWFCGSFCARRSLLVDFPWMPMPDDTSTKFIISVVVPDRRTL